MYVVEIYSIKHRRWEVYYRTQHREDAVARFNRLRNDGYGPRFRREDPQ